MESLGVISKLGAGAAYNAFLLIGALLGLLVIDRISRRTSLIGTFFLGAALLMALVVLADVSPVLAVSLFASFALVPAAAVNLEFVYPPQLFSPTYGVRGRNCDSRQSIGSAASTFLLPIVVATFSINVALIACVVVLAIGGLICWAWAPEMGTESLGEVAEQVQHETDDHTHTLSSSAGNDTHTKAAPQNGCPFFVVQHRPARCPPTPVP